MSIRHMTDVWSDPYYGYGDKVKLLVALAIADSARAEDGVAWPSVDYIARKARCRVRGVQEVCRELVKDGKLEIEVAKGPRGTNLYHFTPRTERTPSLDLQRDPPHRTHPAQNAPRVLAAEKAAEKAPPERTQSVRNGKEQSESEKKESTRFRPPSVEEVTDYMTEKKARNPAEMATEFLDHHGARNWKSGKTAIANWKLAVCTWIRNDRKFHPPEPEIQYWQSPLVSEDHSETDIIRDKLWEDLEIRARNGDEDAKKLLAIR